jgi:hypothetical protein
MIDLNRTTAEIVAEIRAAASAAGIETEAAERWEGDGVTEIWRRGEHGPGTHSLTVAGRDTQYEPAIDADAGDGEAARRGAIRTADEATAWIRG